MNYFRYCNYFFNKIMSRKNENGENRKRRIDSIGPLENKGATLWQRKELFFQKNGAILWYSIAH
jgi:hypothetical protein